MLMIYRAFIRSRLDYGSIAYNSATDALKKLDVIQTSALRISCGAMKGTSNAAIQVECEEMPLDLRRLNQSLKYANKIQSNSNHPTNEILRQTIRSRKTRPTRTTFLATIDPHADQISKVGNTDTSNIPPWHQVRPEINTDLHQNINKRTTNVEEMKARALEHIRRQGDTNISIYTDGSANEQGKVGAAFHIQETNVHGKFRLPDNATILTAELTAIQKALEYIKTSTHDAVRIYTDSLGAIQEIERGDSTNLTKTISTLITEMNIQGQTCEIHWLPSHVGIEGNEEADRLAKDSLDLAEVTIDTDPELREQYKKVDKHTLELWQ